MILVKAKIYGFARYDTGKVIRVTVGENIWYPLMSFTVTI